VCGEEFDLTEFLEGIDTFDPLAREEFRSWVGGARDWILPLLEGLAAGGSPMLRTSGPTFRPSDQNLGTLTRVHGSGSVAPSRSGSPTPAWRRETQCWTIAGLSTSISSSRAARRDRRPPQ
jgi:hypothetical protein